MYETREVHIGDRLIGYLPVDIESGSISWGRCGAIYGTKNGCDRKTRGMNGETEFENIEVGKRFTYKGETFRKLEALIFNSRDRTNCISETSGVKTWFDDNQYVVRLWN